MTNNKRILIIASAANSLIAFRGDFIKSLIKNGYNVFTAAPDYDKELTSVLNKIGVTTLTYSLQRTGLNPLKDFKTISDLKKIIKNNNIDVVFPYTIKPVIYGSIAANSTNVPVVSLITGLGLSFSGINFRTKILRIISEFLYKISIRTNKIIIFQNSDDYALFLERKIINKANKVGFVDGSGVNLNQYKFRINAKDTKNVSFIVVSRLIKEKGIQLYMDAATILKKKYPNAEFHIIGLSDGSPTAIKPQILKNLHDKEIIVYHGAQNNVQEHLYKRDIFVLPTYYREGVPRSILEALSVGLPIITTNSPGCKETVLDGENGFLIPTKDLDALVKAMEYFLINTDKIEAMGKKSRAYAEERFDVKIINANLLKMIEGVL